MDHKRHSKDVPSQSIREKKQKFREMKYKKFMGSKSEGQGFADARKQKMIYQYRKLLRKEEAKANFRGKAVLPQATGGSEKKQEDKLLPDTSVTKNDKKKKLSALKKAQLEYEKKKAEKERQRKEVIEHRKQRDAALALYQDKKKKKYKLLCKKNFRGQPNVACQMALLLEKIQKSKKS